MGIIRCMEILAAVVVGIAVTIVVCAWITHSERTLMGQYEDLKAAVAQVGTDLSEAVARVNAKIEALGDPDPDLTQEIANLQAASQQLDSLASSPDAPPPPGPGPDGPTPPAPEPGDDPGDGPPVAGAGRR